MTRAENRLERLRAALQYLADTGSGRRIEVWEHVESRVPLGNDEQQLNTAGQPQGQSDFLWGTTALVHAGFMEKPRRGEWTVTDAGRAVIRPEVSLAEFGRQLSDRRRAFQRAQRDDLELRLRSEIVPPDNRAGAIRATEQLFVERGLRDLDSVFAPGRTVWRAEIAAELRTHFLEQPEIEGDDFLSKLRNQFSNASDDARLLMAEVICWQILPLQTPGERKKRARVTALLDLMEHPVTIPAEIDSAFRSWSFNPGTGMSVQLFRALSIVVEAVVRWIGLPAEDRAQALDDPWAWRDFVQSLPGSSFPTQRNELLYLVHPGVFGEVVSGENRGAIRAAFIGEIDVQAEDDPDVVFQQITLALQQKVNGPALYYVEPLASRWQKQQLADPTLDPEPGPAPGPIPDPKPVQQERAVFPTASTGLADHLHMPESWLQETLDLIERRKQVILYGPPGTGKTFLAQALSKHVTDGTDGETTVVQFHPTYSYEDFFEGFRPVANDDSGTLAFSLRKGPLRRLADAAAANPEANYFLVIDEINRGNIAKVFGELYFLLEYRDSEISLLYSDEPFILPSNIFVIGTMNTADRSIAMLDAAMRRRFAFVELHPEGDPVRDVLARWAATKGLQDDRADLLARLNAAIADHDAKVGPSFLMRDLDAGGLADVWRYEILPLLAEHHYGDGVDLVARYGLAALRRQATPSVADGAEGADSAG